MQTIKIKLSGVVSITPGPVQTFDGITRPTYCRTLFIENADGTKCELDLFGDTPEVLAITEAT